MLEGAATKKCAEVLTRTFPRCLYYKHCDKMSPGRPDSTFTWNGTTSWLEFKMLEGGEDVHAKHAKDTHGLAKDQLIQLMRLERAGAPSWVIAYRKATRSMPDHLTIYRPSALLTPTGNTMPTWQELSTHATVLRDLTQFGVAAFAGFDHHAVAALIQHTHV